MNVYDFDGTIYDGDSTLDFWYFCLKKHPQILLYLPYQCFGMVKYKLKIIDKTKFKECFFSFVKQIDILEKDVKEFWDLNEFKIMNWYKENQKKDDLIISASPFFLLNEICKRQKIEYLIASKVDPKTGYFDGNNCYGEEKVIQFFKRFPDHNIDAFYSDSYSDNPMASIAIRAYFVKKEKLYDWYFAEEK